MSRVFRKFDLMIDFKKVVGKSENYFLAILVNKQTKLDFYIYEDEAGVMLNNKDWIIFEKPDYKTADDLIAAYVSKVEDLLQRNSGTRT